MLKKRRYSFVLFPTFAFLVVAGVYVQNVQNVLAIGWTNVGSLGFSAGTPSYLNLVLNSTNTPYVAYRDSGNSNKIMVLKYNGSSWVTLPSGSTGISGNDSYTPTMAFDSSGNPYVAMQDGGTGGNSYKAVVKKFDGSSWVTVGSVAATSQQADYPSIAIDSSNNIYVAHMDYFPDGGKVALEKFNGTSWSTVGASSGNGFSDGQGDQVSLALDSTGVPYVAFSDHFSGRGNKATVMKYNGSSWVVVGSPAFSAGQVFSTSIKLDSTNIPYVAYKDVGTSNRITVMKFTSGSWSNVGSAGFNGGATGSEWPSLAFDSLDVPYVGFSDGANGLRTTVMKYNGSSWEAVGSAGFTSSIGTFTSLDLDSNNNPYLGYWDAANGPNKASVSTIDPTIPTITNVSSDKANGTYKTGEVIDIDVTFSETVTSTGSVTVTLETGATDRTCTFTVSGSTTGTCNYTVQAGDTSLDLDTNSISGTIADLSGNAMSSFIPATNLAANKAIVIDTTAPSISITAPLDLAVVSGASVSITADASDDFGVVGVQFKLDSINLDIEDTTSTYGIIWDATSVSDGDHVLTAVARDNVGNTTTSSPITVTVSSVVVPTVTTTIPVTSITQTTAVGGGTISSNGGATVTVSGLVWDTVINPTTALSTKTTDGFAIGGPWTSTMTGLTCDTEYFVRAYATNPVATAYGSIISFSTTACPTEEPSPTPTPSRRRSSSGGRSANFISQLPSPSSALPVCAEGYTLIPFPENPSGYMCSPNTSGIAPVVEITPGIGLPPVLTPLSFTRNLGSGSVGSDVKLLQQYLNSKGFTLALSGFGSPGNETTYFGALTRSALSKFQLAHGITPPVGFFGPITRTFILSDI
ncbi:MAG: Ig-like domain-containing protein [Candidatus Taylorbacteria bacterium]